MRRHGLVCMVYHEKLSNGDVHISIIPAAALVTEKCSSSVEQIDPSSHQRVVRGVDESDNPADDQSSYRVPLAGTIQQHSEEYVEPSRVEQNSDRDRDDRTLTVDGDSSGAEHRCDV